MTPVRFAALISLCATFAGCGGGASSGTGGGGGGGGGNGSPTTVTVKFTGSSLLGLATQIDSGAFTAVTPPSKTVSLTVPAGHDRFAVAYVCQTVSGSGVSQNTYTFQNVLEASTLDGTSFSQNCGSAPPENMGTLTGNVDASAIPGVNSVNISASNGPDGTGYFLSGSSSNFSLAMPSGSDRVAVGGYVYSASNQYGANSVWTLAAVRDFEGVAVPGVLNGGNLIALDASDAVTQQPITYSGVPSGFSSPSTFGIYVWGGHGDFWLSNALTSQYPVVPAAVVRSGDCYSFQSKTQLNLPSGEYQQLLGSTSTTSNGPLNVTFPAPWNYAGPTASAQPVFDFSGAGFSGKTGVTFTGALAWSIGPTEQITFSVVTTGNHLNGATTLVFPSLSGLGGFHSAPPASGTAAVWFAGASKGSSGALQPLCQSGTSTGVENIGFFNVP